jgi:hypothetical protein
MNTTLSGAVTTALTEDRIARTGDSDSTRLADAPGGIQLTPCATTAAQLLAQQPVAEPRQRSITYRFPIRTDAHTDSTDYLNLSARHDPGRKQYTATLSVSTVAVRNGVRTERFSVFGNSVAVLATPTARFSRKALHTFADTALSAAREHAADDAVTALLNTQDGVRS